MSTESKTAFPVSPQGEPLAFPPGILYTVGSREETISSVAEEKIKYLQEENRHLRLQIKALKRLVKNASC